MAESKHLLIVYHSQSGSTERMAQAVIAGARHPDVDGVELRVRDALEADADDVLWADAMILGTPENFGYMSGAMKYFLDRVYYPCLDRVAGRPYALFIRAGNEGSGAITSLERILSGLALKKAQAPVAIVGEFDESRLAECEALGPPASRPAFSESGRSGISRSSGGCGRAPRAPSPGVSAFRGHVPARNPRPAS